MQKAAWIVCPTLAATAFAFLGDWIFPGAFNDINKGLLATLYVVAGWALARKGE